ncbi:MAG: DUF2244 domain-containing protein [Gammaproteobacteria bacterium]|nr:DUF2244 domain-containing protein [Gammaproteobacteria bacterium]NKB65324.1 DUF2244 domain-containing protein [Gammaproteobacteria bacterium]
MARSCSEFVIQPNAAYHGRRWLGPFVLLVVICLGVALRFAWLGYWMILPFAVMDVVTVGFVLWFVVKKSQYTERILISREELQIEHIEREKAKNWCFPLHWAQVKLTPPEHRWYPESLMLGWRGEWVEIGQCLTSDERQSLAKELRKEINRLQQPDFPNHA